MKSLLFQAGLCALCPLAVICVSKEMGALLLPIPQEDNWPLTKRSPEGAGGPPSCSTVAHGPGRPQAP